MTTQHDKPKRWRPRFSVRTLVIVVTLVCCYAACWGPTKRQGVEDVRRYACMKWADLKNRDLERKFGETLMLLYDGSPSEIAPLVISIDAPPGTDARHYYFWFFGYVAKLPYEREVPPLSPQS